MKCIPSNVSLQIFEVKPENLTGMTATIPDHIKSMQKMTMTGGVQFPLVSNDATTGHKLHGTTIASITINNWRYQSNWPYVVLSRVKTMNGLFI